MAQEKPTLQQLLSSPGIKRRFVEILDSSAPAFISSILTIVNNNAKLKECSPNSILSAAGIAAALRLPINPSLGFAHIVPYKSKSGTQAQFQLGYRGFIQLALRSGQYKTLHAGAVYEGEIKSIDCITGEIIRGEKISDNVVGYVAFMRLINGFEKTLYMSVEEIQSHAAKYSQSYAYDLRSGKKSSVWSLNFGSMAKKTVLKKLLSNFGIISIDQQSAALATAIQADQAVILEEGLRYMDNDRGSERIVPLSDIIELPSDDSTDDDAENNSEEIEPND